MNERFGVDPWDRGVSEGEVRAVATRRYTKRRRAALQQETRQRIVDAAIALHETKGGAATISEIADRAGVGRVTVYRHFPDERSLLSACTSHYLREHPPPDPETWRDMADPLQRLERGLTEIYAYHRETQAMMTVAEFEVMINPTLGDLLEPMYRHWAQVRESLVEPWAGHPAAREIEATIGLVISLAAWRVLTQGQEKSDAEAVALSTRLVGRLAGEDSSA
jgi:AcrR family transcriptional regulator